MEEWVEEQVMGSRPRCVGTQEITEF
jgi:hypothetical protein